VSLESSAILLLREFVENVRAVGGLDDVRFGELDDEPGWPDMQETFERAARLLAACDTSEEGGT
jgi:hypothetical protein